MSKRSTVTEIFDFIKKKNPSMAAAPFSSRQHKVKVTGTRRCGLRRTVAACTLRRESAAKPPRNFKSPPPPTGTFLLLHRGRGLHFNLTSQICFGCFQELFIEAVTSVFLWLEGNWGSEQSNLKYIYNIDVLITFSLAPSNPKTLVSQAGAFLYTAAAAEEINCE